MPLALRAVDFVCFIGRNRSGGSTLIPTFSGLQPRLSGTAVFESNPIADMSAQERVQAIQVITEDRVSSPGLLARDVIELSLELAGQLWVLHDGRLSFGDSDALISDGIIERVFDNEDVSFDASQRRFTTTQHLHAG